MQHSWSLVKNAPEVAVFCCRFNQNPPPLDENEPENLADAIATMGLNHAVITVVNRDDLPDSGALDTTESVSKRFAKEPRSHPELLCSDLTGDHQDLAELLNGLELKYLLIM